MAPTCKWQADDQADGSGDVRARHGEPPAEVVQEEDGDESGGQPNSG